MPPRAPGNMGKYAFWGTILLVAVGLLSTMGRKRSDGPFAPIADDKPDTGLDVRDAD